ncbi:MAG: RNA methyltransferase [Anaerolineales bacterium]
MITSNTNPKIKWVRSLLTQAKARRAEGTFVIEGVRLIEEALHANFPVRLLLHTPNLNARANAIRQTCETRAIPIEAVSPQILDSLSDTQTPQGVLAVMGQHSLRLPSNLNFLLIADEVRDPGNLGTLLRTAAAFGAGAVALTPGCADVFAPKVLRAAMGAHFHLPMLQADWGEIAAFTRARGLHPFVAAARQGAACSAADLRQPLALIIGGEAQGAGGQAFALAADALHIPMPGAAESLNAAVAAAILLYEVTRQRGA